MPDKQFREELTDEELNELIKEDSNLQCYPELAAALKFNHNQQLREEEEQRKWLEMQQQSTYYDIRGDQLDVQPTEEAPKKNFKVMKYEFSEDTGVLIPKFNYEICAPTDSDHVYPPSFDFENENPFYINKRGLKFAFKRDDDGFGLIFRGKIQTSAEFQTAREKKKPHEESFIIDYRLLEEIGYRKMTPHEFVVWIDFLCDQNRRNR